MPTISTASPQLDRSVGCGVCHRQTGFKPRLKVPLLTLGLISISARSAQANADRMPRGSARLNSIRGGSQRTATAGARSGIAGPVLSCCASRPPLALIAKRVHLVKTAIAGSILPWLTHDDVCGSARNTLIPHHTLDRPLRMSRTHRFLESLHAPAKGTIPPAPAIRAGCSRHSRQPEIDRPKYARWPAARRSSTSQKRAIAIHSQRARL